MLNLYCEYDGKFQSYLVCIYRCPKARKEKCCEYAKKFAEIFTEPIDPKYIERYGEPEYVVPLSLKKKLVLESLTPEAAELRNRREQGKPSDAKKKSRERMKARQEQREKQ